MGMWYTRREAQKRFSFFFSSTTLAGAFGGVLAAGIGKMEGVRGYSGWRWVFILEGLATVVAGIFCFFLVSDFPEEVSWLNDEERDFLRAKLARDVGKANHNTKLTFRDVLDVFKDCMCPFRFILQCTADHCRQGSSRGLGVLRTSCHSLWYGSPPQFR